MAKKQNPVVVPHIAEELVTPVGEVQEPMVEETTPQDEEVKTPEIAKPTLRVGARARELILAGELDNKGILEILKKEYPNGSTSMACVAWYKSDVKKAKAKQPDPDQGYKDWLKTNEMELRAKYEESLVVA